MFKKQQFLMLMFFLIIAYLIADKFYFSPKIAYISTTKLLVSFSDAAKAEKELKAEDDKWQGQLKQLQDSLQAAMDQMSKEFNQATVARKKEMQDMLSARNQQINNFRQANIRQMDELRQKKLQTVYDKVNVFISEYGKKHHYAIIFGTAAGGSILYGGEGQLDITADIVKGLNERYR